MGVVEEATAAAVVVVAVVGVGVVVVDEFFLNDILNLLPVDSMTTRGGAGAEASRCERRRA